MECPLCGSEISESVNVCPHCGRGLEVCITVPEPLRTLRRTRPLYFIYTFWAGVIFSILAFPNALYGVSVLIWFALALVVGALGYSLVIMHRALKAIQPASNGLRPILTIALLFVPVFNIYWIYRAFVGLAMESGRFCLNMCAPAPNPDPDLRRCRPVSVVVSRMVALFTIVVITITPLPFPLAAKSYLWVGQFAVYSVLVLNWATFVNGIVDQVGAMQTVSEPDSP